MYRFLTDEIDPALADEASPADYTSDLNGADAPATTGTTEVLTLGYSGIVGGTVSSSDNDWYRVTLTAGQTYAFLTTWTGGTAPSPNPNLTLRDSSGAQIAFDDNSGGGGDALIIYTATSSGTFYIDVGQTGASGNTTYRVDMNRAVGGTDTVAGNTSTSAVLTVGAPATGVIETFFDTDYYAVTLVAGQSYLFTLEGSGGSPLEDPYLELFRSNGVLIAFNDDIGDPSGSATHNTNSGLRYTATTSGTYYVAASGYTTQTGGYTLAATAVAPQDPLRTIDWGEQVASNQVRIYFARTSDSYGATQNWSTAQMAAVMAAGGLFAEVANLTFTKVDTAGEATMIMVMNGNLGAGVLGQMQTPPTLPAIGQFNPNYVTDSTVVPGGDGFATIIHEMGHGLGLAHPHDLGGTSEVMEGVTGPFDSFGPWGLNQGVYTMMSYNDGVPSVYNNTSVTMGFQATPMALDIAVLQAHYGATTRNTGDTVYTLESTSGRYQAIWDTGGTDSITYSGSANVVIDLRPATLLSQVGGGGFLSSLATLNQTGGRGGYTIAAGVVIEDATGGSGLDTLTGNAANNRLIGNAANDMLEGGAGDDLLDGGDGADWAAYTLAAAGVTVNLNLAGAQNTGGAGVDTLVSIENFLGSAFDDLVIATNGANLLEGGEGNDTVSYVTATSGVTVRAVAYGASTNTGGSGTDYLNSIENLIGSSFSDTLSGDEFANRLTGGAGDDRLDGGDGQDVAIFSGARASYTVTLDATFVTVAGPDGTDVVTTVETLQFADQSLQVSALPNQSLSTITVSNAYTVNTGSSMRFANQTGFWLDAVVHTDRPALTNSGSVLVTTVGGFNGTIYGIQYDGFIREGLFWNKAGATLTVSAMGSGMAYGLTTSSGGWSSPFDNDGAITVSSASGFAVGANFAAASLETAFDNSGTLTVSGTSAIGLYMSAGVFRNSGTISVSAHAAERGVGVYVGTHTVDFLNTGTISVTDQTSGLDSIAIALGGNVWNATVITNGGTLTGDFSIKVDGGSDAYRIVNQSGGVLNGKLEMGAGNDTIDNAGTINGDVRLGNGNNTFNGQTGQVSGVIYGGFGNNTIYAGAGNDTVYGTAGSASGQDGTNLLSGGAGADHLYGGGNADQLIGGAGDDVLDGAGGTDRAIFSGQRSAYTVSTVGGVTTVTGADGTDTLTNIETLVFDDQTLQVGQPGGGPTTTAMSTVTVVNDYEVTTLQILTFQNQHGFALTGSPTNNHASLNILGEIRVSTTAGFSGYVYGAYLTYTPHYLNTTETTTVRSGATLSVVNSGTGDAYGFVTPHKSNFENSGVTTVTAAQGNAYGVEGSNSQVFNWGSLTVSGTIARGVNLTSGGYFNNDGQVTVNAHGSGFAIGVTLSGWQWNCINHGTITVTDQTSASASVGILAQGYTGFFADRNISNFGTINAEVAIKVDRGDSGIGGSYIIINYGTGVLNGAVLFGAGDDRFDNEGVVNGNVELGSGANTFNGLTGRVNGVVIGGAGVDQLNGGTNADRLRGGQGNDIINGGANIDTAIFSGNRSAYTITHNSNGSATVTGTDGSDTLTNVEYFQFADQTVQFRPGTGTSVNFTTADPDTYMGAIRDFDGNDLGAPNDWLRIGQVDLQGDGDIEQIFVNRVNGRWASLGPADDGLVYFGDHGWAGDTRVVGIYIDPLVQSGEVVQGGPHDSQRRFQNDLFIENINGILGAGDYDHDGLQEVYFRLTDGTAYLHAYMHADGNIRYANYQNQQQVIDFLTANGWSSSTYAGWFG